MRTWTWTRLAAALLVVGLGTAACGGDEGGSGGSGGSDGSGGGEVLTATEFCERLGEVDDAETVGDAMDTLEGLELSEEIPADAQGGFQTFVELLGRLPDDTATEDIEGAMQESLGATPDPEMATEVTAFFTWAEANCNV